jgi:phenylpropionate dioxygenase-like ring-hydroxylating dioxygenase large terminal subunit
MRQYSVAQIRHHWYIACESAALKAKPLPVTILDTPLVLFRHEKGEASALLDRCAHRNVPLSLGYVEDCRLVCGYHGWEYDGGGVCQKVPALTGEQTGKARRVPAFPTKERAGYVWVYLDPDTTPTVEPFEFPLLDDRAYSTVRYQASLQATLHASLENILDVPHTAFLHRGLFRGVKRNEITAVVKRTSTSVEAEFIGEPRPTGVIGSILAPQGGTVIHFDRFFLPSIAQVEYRLGDKNHLMVTSALTPVSNFETKLWAVVTFRTIVPPLLLKPIMMPIAKKVLAQDQVMLKHQTDAVQRFEGEQFASTDVDLLGPHIWRILKDAERKVPAHDDVHEERVQLLA